MPLNLFSPFARYVVVKIDHVYYPNAYGEVETAKPVRPEHYTDDRREAEDVAFGLSEGRDGRYEVYENSAWKALNKRANILKATAEGDSLSIEMQLGVAAEVLHDILNVPEYPEEKFCKRCEQPTGNPDKTLCPDCESYTKSLARKCACCSKTGCVPGLKICGMCKAAEESAQRERARKHEEAQRKLRTSGVALGRSDAPDSPASKPKGSAVWAKTGK